MDSQKVGRRIQEVRKSRGITQSELAQRVDLSTKYISNIECGFKTPTLETFIAIANALQSDANSLLSDVLDVTTSQESGLVSKKLLGLPAEEQRRLLRMLEVMIDETGSKWIATQHESLRQFTDVGIFFYSPTRFDRICVFAVVAYV